MMAIWPYLLRSRFLVFGDVCTPLSSPPLCYEVSPAKFHRPWRTICRSRCAASEDSGGWLVAGPPPQVALSQGADNLVGLNLVGRHLSINPSRIIIISTYRLISKR